MFVAWKTDACTASAEDSPAAPEALRHPSGHDHHCRTTSLPSNCTRLWWTSLRIHSWSCTVLSNGGGCEELGMIRADDLLWCAGHRRTLVIVGSGFSPKVYWDLSHHDQAVRRNICSRIAPTQGSTVQADTPAVRTTAFTGLRLGSNLHCLPCFISSAVRSAQNAAVSFRIPQTSCRCIQHAMN